MPVLAYSGGWARKTAPGRRSTAGFRVAWTRTAGPPNLRPAGNVARSQM